MTQGKYRINEIFTSLQGEGVRAGTVNTFVRFSGCNLKCAIDDEFSGFDCDTEFTSGQDATLQEIIETIAVTGDRCKNVILTGGEPGLQVDDLLIGALKREGYYIAIETNGTRELPAGIDWICVSPKSAEHTLRVHQRHRLDGDKMELFQNIVVDELKYVRRYGQGIPKPSLQAEHKLISPAFEPDSRLARQTLEHCIQLVKENPEWRLSMQLHKFWGIR
jgi:7-carboxy-7-deazaguanine synthase